MTTRSIFQKTCPVCMITLSLDASSCACGHQFDHDDSDTMLSSEEIRVKAEELYENYLAARAEQAASAVMTAQAEFAYDPGSAQKSQRVASAIQASEEARAALAAQSARVAEMKRALPTPAPRPMPVPATVAAKKKVVPTKPVAVPAPARSIARTVNAVAHNAIVASARAKRVTRKAASVPAKTRPVPAPASVAAQPEIILPPVQTKIPNPAFRQAQAAKADKILRQAETPAAVKAVIKEESVVAPRPAPKKISASPPILSKSAPRLLGSEKKECPNCTSSVDAKLSHCRCGYEFATSGTLMPALSMSEEERAEFAKLFGFP